jgi:Na+/phosphate symporter
VNSRLPLLIPDHASVFILFFIAGFIIIYFGLMNFSDGMISPYGNKLVNLMTKTKKTRLSQFLRGFFISQIIVRKNIVMAMFFELSNAGLIRFKQGTWLLVGANLANVFIFYFLMGLKLHIGLWFFIPAAIFFILSFFNHSEWLFKLFSGLSFLFLGQILISSQLHSVLFKTADYQWLFLLVPLIISFVTASPLLAILPFVQFYQTPSEYLWVVILTHLGATASYLRKRKNANIYAKRFILFQVFYEITGVLSLYIFYSFGFFKLDLPNSPRLLAHFFFVLNAAPLFLMLIMESQIVQFILKLAPDTELNENFKLQKLGNFELNDDLIPAIGISQILYQVVRYKNILDRMFILTTSYIKLDKVDPKMLHKIKEYERVSDNMRTEIIHYIKNIMRSPLDEGQAQKLLILNRVTHELEKISDYLDKLATHYTSYGSALPESIVTTKFYQYLEDVTCYFNEVTGVAFENLKSPEKNLDQPSHDLRERAHQLRSQILGQITDTEDSGDAQNIQHFGDMVIALRKIRSHSHNIYQSLS